MSAPPITPTDTAFSSSPSPPCASSPTAALLVAHTEPAAQRAAELADIKHERQGKEVPATTDEGTAATTAAAADTNGKAAEESLWYFAIGSMMNPTSMSLRGLCPSESRPGVLHDWRLVFRGVGGMGDIAPAPGESFHGVLHRLTPAEFRHLDSIEAVYHRQPVTVCLYDGTPMDALAYKMDNTKLDPNMPNNLPNERYLDIIIRGAVHYGVAPEYIERLKAVKTTPRKAVADYRKVPTPPDRVISRAEFEKAKGACPYAPEPPLMASVNGKVLQWATVLGGAADNSDARAEVMYEWSRNRYGGTDMTLALSKVLYEPLYPIPTTFEAMTPDMRAWAEELFVGFTRATPEGDRCGHWRVIGWLEGFEPDHLRRKAEPASEPQPQSSPSQTQQQPEA